MYQPQQVIPQQVIPQQMYQPMYQPVYQPMYQPAYQPAYPQPVYQLRASSFTQQLPPAPAMVPAPAMAPAPVTKPAMAPAPAGATPPPQPPPSGAQQGAPPAPVGPTPECPCLTTPAPTEEPGSPEASEEAVEQAAKDAAKDGKQEILEAGQKEITENLAKVKKAGEEGSKELATKELQAVREKRLGPHMDKFQAEKDNADEIEQDMKDKARDAALEHTKEITKAAADLSTIKSQNVINKVLAGSAE